LGSADFHEGEIVKIGDNLITVEVTPDFRICCSNNGSRTYRNGERITFATRPEDFNFVESPIDRPINTWQANLDDYMFLGESLTCELSIGKVSFRIRADKRYPVESNKLVWIHISPEFVMPL
jgi:hypothetical protein